MVTRRAGWLFSLLGVTAALGMGPGCTEKKKDKPTDSPAASAAAPAQLPPAVQLSEQQRQAATELEGKLKGGTFPVAATRDKNNARLFLYIADTSQDPGVVAGALRGMDATYSSYDKAKGKELADEAYANVILKHLGSDEPPVQGWAIEAADAAVTGEKADARVVQKLVEIATAHPKPEAQQVALEALRRVRQWGKQDPVADAFLRAMGSEVPYVASTALFAVMHEPFLTTHREPMLRQAQQLLQHKDPGVRGRASQVVGRLGRADPKLGEQVEAMLGDADPFVRSAAASAVADMGRASAIHKLIKLVDDSARNTYDLKDWRKLTGAFGWVHHDGSAWSRVDDAALRSIQRLSAEMDAKFIYEQVDTKDLQGGLKKAATKAKLWYAKNKAKIPAA